MGVVLRVCCLALAILCLADDGSSRAQAGDLADAQRRVLQFNLASDFEQSLAWAEKALTFAERDYGARSTEAATAHVTIAIQNQSLGRLPTAEKHFRQGLAIQEQLVPADDPSLSSFLAGLGGTLYGQGRYSDAEPFMRKSVHLQEILSRRTGDQTGLAVALYLLGTTYTSMARLDDGNRLLARSLAMFEQTFPQGSLQIGLVLNNLATNRQLAADYAAAARYQQRALELIQRFSPGNLFGLAKINNNLGFLLQKAGVLDKASEHYRQALSQLAKVFPEGHPDIATANANYGSLLLDLGRGSEAEPLLDSALAMRQRWLPADHTDIAVSHSALADLWIRRGDWRRAVVQLRAAAAIYIARADRQDTGRGSPADNDIGQNATVFGRLVKAQWRLARLEAEPSFIMAQRAIGSSAATSLAQMSTRSAKGDPRLAALVRSRQDLVVSWNEFDRRLVAALSNPTLQPSASAPIRQRLAALDARITALDGSIAVEFPEFAALTNPSPLTIADVQAQLHDDEALVLFLDTPAYPEIHPAMPEETFIWVVTRTSRRWTRSRLGSVALAREVAALRCGLDFAGGWSAGTPIARI